MNSRRKLLVALSAGAFAAPLACFAQQERSKVARIGVLESTSSSANQRDLLIAGLRELGYVEGKNMIIEDRWAEGQYERLPGLAAELVQMKVDVIIAGGSPAVQAAQQATTTIPIVMVRIGDPVGSGFVASLARPGRNITGPTNILVDVASKYVELLRAAAPKLSRVTVLVNPANPVHRSGSANSDRQVSGSSAKIGLMARRSREHETTPSQPLSSFQSQGGSCRPQG
jgi:putative ABC transport system substrate-binding protein